MIGLAIRPEGMSRTIADGATPFYLKGDVGLQPGSPEEDTYFHHVVNAMSQAQC
jgi:hypothetical protein